MEDEILAAVKDLVSPSEDLRREAAEKCIQFQNVSMFSCEVFSSLVNPARDPDIRAFALESLTTVIRKSWSDMPDDMTAGILGMFPFHPLDDNLITPVLAQTIAVFFAYMADPETILLFFTQEMGLENPLLCQVLTCFIIEIFLEEFPTTRTEILAELVFGHIPCLLINIVMIPLCQNFQAGWRLDCAVKIHEFAPANAHFLIESPEGDEIYAELAKYVWKPLGPECGGIVSIFETLFSLERDFELPMTFDALVASLEEIPSSYEPLWSDEEFPREFLPAVFDLIEQLRIRIPLMFMIIQKVSLEHISGFMELSIPLMHCLCGSVLLDFATEMTELLSDQDFLLRNEEFCAVFTPHLRVVFEASIVLCQVAVNVFPCSVVDTAWNREFEKTMIDCAAAIANLDSIEWTGMIIQSISANRIGGSEFRPLVKLLRSIVPISEESIEVLHDAALECTLMILNVITDHCVETQAKACDLLMTLRPLLVLDEESATEIFVWLMRLMFLTKIDAIHAFDEYFDRFVDDNAPLIEEFVRTNRMEISPAHEKYGVYASLCARFSAENQIVIDNALQKTIDSLTELSGWTASVDTSSTRTIFKKAVAAFRYIENSSPFPPEMATTGRGVGQLIIAITNTLLREAASERYTSQMINLMKDTSTGFVNFVKLNPWAILEQIGELALPAVVTAMTKTYLEVWICPIFADLYNYNPAVMSEYASHAVNVLYQSVTGPDRNNKDLRGVLDNYEKCIFSIGMWMCIPDVVELVRSNGIAGIKTNKYISAKINEFVSYHGWPLMKEIFQYFAALGTTDQFFQDKLVELIMIFDKDIAKQPSLLRTVNCFSTSALAEFKCKSASVTNAKRRRALYRDLIKVAKVEISIE